MSNKTYKQPERQPSHPGRILKSGFIDTHQLRIETVAQLLGITRVHLSRIINGHSPVTSDIAIRLEILTQMPASQWLTLQAHYDTYQLQQGNHFQSYKDTLSQWAANSLGMVAKERRHDPQTRTLVTQAALLAKQIGQKGDIVS